MHCSANSFVAMSHWTPFSVKSVKLFYIYFVSAVSLPLGNDMTESTTIWKLQVNKPFSL